MQSFPNYASCCFMSSCSYSFEHNFFDYTVQLNAWLMTGFTNTPFSTKVALGIVLWSLKAIVWWSLKPSIALYSAFQGLNLKATFIEIGVYHCFLLAKWATLLCCSKADDVVWLFPECRVVMWKFMLFFALYRGLCLLCFAVHVQYNIIIRTSMHRLPQKCF